ncbi:MAG: hypothetical protein FWE40_09470 [Oscillospiraceae bacterium]|nr:hypothetical protein [Oscillospiraceae bacterium]
MKKRSLAGLLAVCVLLAGLTLIPSAAQQQPACPCHPLRITNPYAAVNWNTWGQYRVQLHTHTTASDGQSTHAELIEAYFAAGYDALAITDHGVVDRGWIRPNHPPFDNVLPFLWERNIVGLAPERYAQINAGYGRDGRPMIRIPFGNEQNPQSFDMVHVVSWFADWGHAITHITGNYRIPIRGVHRAGGISIVAHPSIAHHAMQGGQHTPFFINQIQRDFEDFSSLLGIEVFNPHDITLWDILLQNLAPAGRNIFLFATDDAHNHTTQVDRRWVVSLMPANTAANIRTNLETGAFFSAVRTTNDRTQPEPVVTEIAIDDTTISIQTEHVYAIEWISNGEVFAHGNAVDLADYLDVIGAYVRAELHGQHVLLYTQPFLLQYDDMPEPTFVPDDFVDPSDRDMFWPFVFRAVTGWIFDVAWRGYLWVTGLFA